MKTAQSSIIFSFIAPFAGSVLAAEDECGGSELSSHQLALKLFLFLTRSPMAEWRTVFKCCQTCFSFSSRRNDHRKEDLDDDG